MTDLLTFGVTTAHKGKRLVMTMDFRDLKQTMCMFNLWAV